VSTPKAENKAPQRVNSAATISYVSLCGVFAMMLVVLGVRTSGWPADVLGVIVLAGMGITSWLLRETDVGSRVQFSFVSIILLAAAVIVGPVGAAIVGALATVVQLNTEPVIVRVFNVLLFSSMGSLGGLSYLWVGGIDALDMSGSAARILLGVGLPLIAADVAQCLLNALMLGGVLRFATGTPLRTQVLKLLSTTGLAYIGYGVIGFLFVVLWIPARVGWFSAVLVLAPLFVARWAFVQYGDELRAHDRTLRALVTAVETKDPSNNGHSERTAQVAEWLAETLGMGHKEIQDVRTAAMLHDIGKVCVRSKVLRARQPLTDDELVAMAEHAVSGVELVQGIDFLAGSVDGIAHHHERFDGLGYPAGLKGEAIPLAARLVAVADTFDTLTTSRPYRASVEVNTALEEITARAGTQFDPAVVDALRRALGRHEWATTERTPEQLAGAAVTLDHDEPEISDLFAERHDLRARLKGGATSVALPAGRTS
jgi:putative nucleotidyltransferase with HDIG domain